MTTEQEINAFISELATFHFLGHHFEFHSAKVGGGRTAEKEHPYVAHQLRERVQLAFATRPTAHSVSESRFYKPQNYKNVGSKMGQSGLN